MARHCGVFPLQFRLLKHVADVTLCTRNFLRITCQAPKCPYKARRCRLQPCDEVRKPAVVLAILVAHQGTSFACILLPVRAGYNSNQLELQ